MPVDVEPVASEEEEVLVQVEASAVVLVEVSAEALVGEALVVEELAEAGRKGVPIRPSAFPNRHCIDWI